MFMFRKDGVSVMAGGGFLRIVPQGRHSHSCSGLLVARRRLESCQQLILHRFCDRVATAQMASRAVAIFLATLGVGRLVLATAMQAATLSASVVTPDAQSAAQASVPAAGMHTWMARVAMLAATVKKATRIWRISAPPRQTRAVTRARRVSKARSRLCPVCFTRIYSAKTAHHARGANTCPAAVRAHVTPRAHHAMDRAARGRTRRHHAPTIRTVPAQIAGRVVRGHSNRVHALQTPIAGAPTAAPAPLMSTKSVRAQRTATANAVAAQTVEPAGM